jgi:uncharacterized OsmC-like protein
MTTTATTATTPTTPTTRNGVDVDRLVATIEAIKGRPELADFRFRARTTWEAGGHARTIIQDFFGAGSEDTSRARPMILEGDEPPVLLGTNRAPNAVEALLHALGSCLAVGFVYNAAARGIEVRGFDVELEGDLDLQGFLGLSEQVRPGCRQIRVSYLAETDAPGAELEALWEHVQRTSPLLDIIRNPVTVTLRARASGETP